jgi:PASTA domain
VTRFKTARAGVGQALLVAAVLVATALVMPAVASAQSAPPETTFTQVPPNPSGTKTASFAFTGTDDTTPAIDLEFECRLDAHLAPPGTDPLDLWLECLSPQFFSGLTVGQHTFEVQALDGDGLIDPTPATYTWTVLPPQTCADASETVAADADAWFDEHDPIKNNGADSTLKLISKAPSENSRVAVRFPLPQAPAGCVVQSATLKLYSDSAPTVPGKLQALRLTSAWGENNITWGNQPATLGPAAEALSAMGYVQWNVTALVQAGAGHGFLIRHAIENDPAGAEEGFFSKEKLENPPELVVCYENCSSGGGGGGIVPVPPVPFPGILPPLPVPPVTVPPVGVSPVGAPALPVAPPATRPVVKSPGATKALRCRVPNVKRRTLGQARTALGRAGCRVGAIRKRFSKVKKGRVIAQSPGRVGTRAYRGFRVNLVLSKGKKPRRAAR